MSENIFEKTELYKRIDSEISRETFELTGEVVLGLLKDFQEQCNELAKKMKYDNETRRANLDLIWPRECGGWARALYAQEKVLRALGLNTAVDQVRMTTLESVNYGHLREGDSLREILMKKSDQPSPER